MEANSFIGCLDDVKINGQLVDPRQTPFVGDAIEGFGISKLAISISRPTFTDYV